MNIPINYNGIAVHWHQFPARGGTIPFKLLITMKLFALYLLILCSCSFADVRAQKVSVDVKNARFQDVAFTIQKQTGYSFAISKRYVAMAKPVTMKMNEADLEKVLTSLFREQPFSYAIDGKIISLIDKPKTKTVGGIEAIDVLQQSIRGRVTNEKGEPMSGASVQVKGSSKTVRTNANGEFLITGVNENSILIISYLGYTSQELKVQKEMGTVVMVEQAGKLDELVINAGYYTVKDKERTGSISKITAKEISQQPVANPLAAMQGRMAGVHITQSSGTPGGGFDIQIRGRNSLRTEGNAPLYIVDGVPYTSQSISDYTLSSGVLSSGDVSPLNSINPDDIESIEVLKDADATAIYGSRGANGVVLITTKKGTTDAPQFSVSLNASVSNASRLMKLMNTEQYLQMRRSAYTNDGITDYPANAYDVNGTWNQNRYTDWQKEFIGNTAISQNSRFSVGGGSANTQYLFSAGYRKDETAYGGDFGYDRKNVMLQVNHISSDRKFSFNSNFNGALQKNKLMSTDLGRDIFMAPNAPELYLPDGSLNWEKNTFENPMAKLNSRYSSEISDLIGNASLDYQLTPVIKASLNGGITMGGSNEKRTRPSTMYNPAYGIKPEFSVLNTSNASRNGWIVEPKISGDLDLGNNSLSFIVGATVEERRNALLSHHGENFTSNYFIDNLSAAATQRITRDSETMYRYMAVYGRLNYTVKNRYILNVTSRRDGSSRFGANNRFANFGAVGGAWLFSREKILENSSWLSFGKLRGSYGTTGSDLIGDYQFLQVYSVDNSKYDNIPGIRPLKLYNPDFSWEKNRKMEVALELELFNAKVAPSVSWYRNRSSNQLVGIPLPATTGFNTLTGNLDAEVENTGWEFTLSTKNVSKGNFMWTTNFNISIPRNRLVAFPNLEQSAYASQYVVGRSVHIKKLYHFEGVDPEKGIYKFSDANNDGILNDEDRTALVDVGVRTFGGLQNTFRYKNWNFDFLWQFVVQKGYNALYGSPIAGIMYNLPVELTDSWTSDNTDAKYQRTTTGNMDVLQAFQRYKLSNAMISDASFLRLKNVNLQYRIPTTFFKGVTADVFLQAQNLFTITSYFGSDPETLSTYVPTMRTVSFGFNMNF
ncbi:TonB-linked outer membrane protein, SusC/RagA family [Sphingobacterium nematocida]|uniref:TonB-linked outer membrane protein, SusC/RagA family n=1 Tax=Sphingobacterium nematocida TaxID=1513896 RepID=A0A1T5GQF7_9SPHI|nr:SusC/RagA family TonB-linked outer membrane protein [Sphingobacterium nematocida]SKC10643.1 TonB-linked outer membrane protein, SusC/RagA family [Sphingobacterium nematocida]